MLLAVSALLFGMWAGLIRLGWVLPVLQPPLPMLHGPLMVCGFLGTLIGLERAVGTGKRWAYAGPALTAAGRSARPRRRPCPGWTAADHAWQPRHLCCAADAGAPAACSLYRRHRPRRPGVGDRQHAVAGRPADPLGGAVVDQLPGADDRRRAPGTEPDAQAVTHRTAAVWRDRVRPAGRSGAGRRRLRRGHAADGRRHDSRRGMAAAL